MTISNILGCTGSVILILLVPLFWPLLPMPFLFYSSKLGLNEGIKVSLIALLTVGIVGKLLGMPGLVFFCLKYVIAGLILSELFKRDYSYSLTFFWGTLFLVLTSAIYMLFESKAGGTSPVEIAATYLQDSLNMVVDMYEKKGLKPEQVDWLRKITPTIIDVFKKIIPSIIVIESGFIVWLNVVISKPLFRRKGIRYPDLGRADMWKAPEFMVWVLIVAGFLKLLSISTLDFAAINVLIIVSVIYIINGLSIVLFFFNKYNVPVFARFVIYLIFILQLIPMVIILALMGLFDQWIDFRKINNKAETTE